MKRFIYISIFVALTGCVSFGPTTLSPDNYLGLEGEGSKYQSKGSQPLEEYNNGTIADFESGDIGKWWGSSKIILTKKDGNLVVNASGVGKEYDRFGYTFVPTTDFSKMNIIKIRAKADGNTVPTLRIDLKDRNGFVTNNKDSKARLILCNQYVEYYFRYEGRFSQGWPFKADVDPANISELEIFINPGSQNFTGTIHIDEIKQVTEEQMWKEIEAAKAPCDVSLNNEFKEGIKFCWANSDLYTLSHSEEALKIQVRGAGKGWQSFGIGFTTVDLGMRPVIRIRAKVKGESATQMRVDLVDFSGNVTNGEAIDLTVPNDDTYRDYFFDYQDKMYQGWPVAEKVDSRFINELMIFANPGGPDFTGELFIDEIELVKDYKSPSKPKLKTYFGEGKARISHYNHSSKDNVWWVQGATMSDEKGLEFKGVSSSAYQFGLGVNAINVNNHNELTLAISDETASSKIQLSVMDNRGVISETFKPNSIVPISGGFKLSFDLLEALKNNKEINNNIITGLIFQVDGVENSVQVQSLSSSKK